jgi:hypothetical protein
MGERILHWDLHTNKDARGSKGNARVIWKRRTLFPPERWLCEAVTQKRTKEESNRWGGRGPHGFWESVYTARSRRFKLLLALLSS